MLRFMLISLVLANGWAASSAQGTHIRGWIEHARIMPDALLLSAKLDSGAQTTSIHAEVLAAGTADEMYRPSDLTTGRADTEADASAMLSIQIMQGVVPDDPREADVIPISSLSAGEELPEVVTFRLTSRGGKRRVYTERVVRWVSIRRRGGGSIVRPVVMMDLCVGGVQVEGEVNLADRTGFNYPLLIGRNMLSAARIKVDSGQVFASRRACPDGV